MKFNKNDKKPNNGLVSTTQLVQFKSPRCFLLNRYFTKNVSSCASNVARLINSIEIQNMPRCDSSEWLACLSAYLKRNDTICSARGSLHLRKDPFMLRRCERRNVHLPWGGGDFTGCCAWTHMHAFIWGSDKRNFRDMWDKSRWFRIIGVKEDVKD